MVFSGRWDSKIEVFLDVEIKVPHRLTRPNSHHSCDVANHLNCIDPLSVGSGKSNLDVSCHGFWENTTAQLPWQLPSLAYFVVWYPLDNDVEWLMKCMADCAEPLNCFLKNLDFSYSSSTQSTVYFPWSSNELGQFPVFLMKGRFFHPGSNGCTTSSFGTTHNTNSLKSSVSKKFSFFRLSSLTILHYSQRQNIPRHTN